MSVAEFKNEILAHKAKLISLQGLAECFDGLRPGDFDGAGWMAPTLHMEQRGHFLFLEFKCGSELLDSQRQSYISLAKHLQSHFTLFVIDHADLRDEEVNAAEQIKGFYIASVVNGRIYRTVDIKGFDRFKWWCAQWWLKAKGEPNHFDALFMHAIKMHPLKECTAFEASGLKDHPQLQRWLNANVSSNGH